MSPRPASRKPTDIRTTQARALGDPTRASIFRYVGEAARPVGVASISEHFGLHHNAVRQHLAKLRDAGLLIEELSAPAGPGRPALRYRPVPGVAERWGGPSPFENLSLLLLELLRGGGTPYQVGYAGGERLAREHGYTTTNVDATRALEEVATRLGFEPRRELQHGRVDLVLERCPFAGPATTSPEIVCELHRGMAEGIAATATGAPTVVDLVVNPPTRAGCRLQLARSS